MQDDPIVAEIRRIREKHAATYDYDLEKIFASLKDRAKQRKRKLMSCPPRSQKPVAADARPGGGPDE